MEILFGLGPVLTFGSIGACCLLGLLVWFGEWRYKRMKRAKGEDERLPMLWWDGDGNRHTKRPD